MVYMFASHLVGGSLCVGVCLGIWMCVFCIVCVCSCYMCMCVRHRCVTTVESISYWDFSLYVAGEAYPSVV